MKIEHFNPHFIRVGVEIKQKNTKELSSFMRRKHRRDIDGDGARTQIYGVPSLWRPFDAQEGRFRIPSIHLYVLASL